MRKISFTLKTDPIPWKRAGRSGNRYYDAQSSEKELHILLMKALKHPSFSKNKPLLLSVTFWIQIPKSKKGIIKEGDFHYKRPDNSNFIKFIEDAMQPHLIPDDCLFAGTIAFKRYTHEPRLEISIQEIDERLTLSIGGYE